MLGDLDAIRDWCFAGDVMRGAWLMLQQDRPGDYILASGIPHTVIELAELAFDRVGLNARDYIRVDPSLQRRPESVPLVGDPSRAGEQLGWRPTVSFEQLIGRMVDADLSALRMSSAERR
jgi:GDPmannose 4,6-dehydratase